MDGRKIWRRRRLDERVAARLWVQLLGPTRDVRCATLDLSDTGMRVRIQLRDVGLDRPGGRFDLSRTVTETLGEECVADIRDPKGAHSVRKDVRLVRIGVLRRQAGDFEVGCRFVAPLDEAERRLLGFEAAAARDA